MPNTHNETKALNAAQKTKARAAKSYNLYYEMGGQAAYRGDTVDAMPSFRNTNRVAAWLKGHSDATLEKQRRDEAQRVDKAGIKRLKDIIRQVTGA